MQSFGPDSFLDVVRNVAPSYEQNKKVRGKRAEVFRQIADQLWASHNYMSRGTDLLQFSRTYYHSFCITFTSHPHSFVYYPMKIGGRFDLNLGLKDQMRSEGLPAQHVSDMHSGRKGWVEMVEKSARAAEQQLLPLYLQRIRDRKSALQTIIETAITLTDEVAKSGLDLNKRPEDEQKFYDLVVCTDKQPIDFFAPHFETDNLALFATDLFKLDWSSLAAEVTTLQAKMRQLDWKTNLPVLDQPTTSAAAVCITFYEYFKKDRKVLPSVLRSLSTI